MVYIRDGDEAAREFVSRYEYSGNFHAHWSDKKQSFNFFLENDIS